MKIVKLGLASILSATALFAGSYSVDTTHSTVSFKIKHLMISNVSGEFKNFKGNFTYDEKNKQLVALKGIIVTDSINTNNEKRDNHLKSKDLFNAKRYPSIEFKLDTIKENKAYGALSMKGVTKNVVLDFENNGTVTDPWGNQRVGLAFYGKIDRKDFGISWNKALETGGVMIGEKVKLNIELEGILNK